MSVIADLTPIVVDDRLARRNALVLSVAQALAGKAFLWGLGALGADGPGHVIDLMTDELQSALGQIGAHSPAEARNVKVRHPGALHF